TSAPASSFQLFVRRTPSTATPASITRSALARDPTSWARNASSREPAASSGTRRRRAKAARCTVGCNEREQQDRDADDDETVREVERGPELEVEEVRDVPEPNPVDEVRDAAADHEAERNRKHRMTR